MEIVGIPQLRWTIAARRSFLVTESSLLSGDLSTMPAIGTSTRWKRLANPAPNFFHQPTISEDDGSNPASMYVESLLEHRRVVDGFGRMIAPLNAE